MSSRSGIVFITCFFLLILIAGVIGAILYSFYESPYNGDNPNCEPSYAYDPYSNKCLHFISDMPDADGDMKDSFSRICSQIQNGHLIQILSDEDQIGLQDFMSFYEPVNIWLDIVFQPEDRLWVWPSSNEMAEYTNWSHEYRDGSPGSCAVAKSRNNFEWTDISCQSKEEIFAVCEHEPIYI
eukprot:TRINITY_DN11124_c0_g1_i1.p1 TRINITY_DN11124_c0_g1~~TRINITY_DN11124_c0_g1_i1.p1  ORF type:complete len:182 (+),score=9.78 TRINITY_DN11124_c0_g1_i1:250-795(+)